MNYIAAAPAIKLQQPALLLIYPTLEEAESVTFLHCLKEADVLPVATTARGRKIRINWKRVVFFGTWEYKQFDI
jgi:hypothetical protein